LNTNQDEKGVGFYLLLDTSVPVTGTLEIALFAQRSTNSCNEWRMWLSILR